MRIVRSVSEAIATHSGLTTGVHGVGALHVAGLPFAGGIAVNRTGDIGLGETFKRSGNDNSSRFWGGQTNAGNIALYGKDHATLPGYIELFTPNAAKTATPIALRISGSTDTPELLLCRMAKDRIYDFEHSHTLHTNRTRYKFISVGESEQDGLDSEFGHTFLTAADGVITIVMFNWYVPEGFVSPVSVKLLWSSPAAEGSMYWENWAYWEAAGEAMHNGSYTGLTGVTTTDGTDILMVQTSQTPLDLTGIAVNDLVGIHVIRDASHANDTLNAAVQMYGILIEYISDE